MNISLAIGIVDSARQGHDAIVGKHIPKQRIDCGIVDVNKNDSLAQIIKNHYADCPIP